MAEEDAQKNKQVAKIQKMKGNDVCADCPGTNPLWVSFLKDGQETTDKKCSVEGAFCVIICDNCAPHHHFELGKEFCSIKYLKYAHEWSQEELHCVERSGNALVNECYEAEKIKAEKEVKITEEEEEETGGGIVSWLTGTGANPEQQEQPEQVAEEDQQGEQGGGLVSWLTGSSNNAEQQEQPEQGAEEQQDEQGGGMMSWLTGSSNNDANNPGEEEEQYDKTVVNPVPEEEDAARSKFIRQKYVERKFRDDAILEKTLDKMFGRASKSSRGDEKSHDRRSSHDDKRPSSSRDDGKRRHRSRSRIRNDDDKKSSSHRDDDRKRSSRKDNDERRSSRDDTNSTSHREDEKRRSNRDEDGKKDRDHEGRRSHRDDARKSERDKQRSPLRDDDRKSRKSERDKQRSPLRDDDRKSERDKHSSRRDDDRKGDRKSERDDKQKSSNKEENKRKSGRDSDRDGKKSSRDDNKRSSSSKQSTDEENKGVITDQPQEAQSNQYAGLASLVKKKDAPPTMSESEKRLMQLIDDKKLKKLQEGMAKASASLGGKDNQEKASAFRVPTPTPEVDASKLEKLAQGMEASKLEKLIQGMHKTNSELPKTGGQALPPTITGLSSALKGIAAKVPSNSNSSSGDDDAKLQDLAAKMMRDSSSQGKEANICD